VIDFCVPCVISIFTLLELYLGSHSLVASLADIRLINCHASFLVASALDTPTASYAYSSYDQSTIAQKHGVHGGYDQCLIGKGRCLKEVVIKIIEELTHV
jgi:hypothetical protein